MDTRHPLFLNYFIYPVFCLFVFCVFFLGGGLPPTWIIFHECSVLKIFIQISIFVHITILAVFLCVYHLLYLSLIPLPPPLPSLPLPQLVSNSWFLICLSVNISPCLRLLPFSRSLPSRKVHARRIKVKKHSKNGRAKNGQRIRNSHRFAAALPIAAIDCKDQGRR